MAKVTGIVKIYVNGKLYRSKAGASLNTGGKKREDVTGYDVYGYTEEVMPAELDATIADMADTDIMEMNDMVDATLKFETDTGKSLLVTDAFTSEPCVLKGGGDLSLKMKGKPAIEE